MRWDSKLVKDKAAIFLSDIKDIKQVNIKENDKLKDIA